MKIKLRFACDLNAYSFGRDLKEEGNIRISRSDFNSHSARERRRFVDHRKGTDLSLSLFLPQYPFISVRTDVTSTITPRYIIAEAVMEIARFVTTTADTKDSLGDACVRRSTIISSGSSPMTDAIRTRTKRGRSTRKREEERDRKRDKKREREGERKV